MVETRSRGVRRVADPGRHPGAVDRRPARSVGLGERLQPRATSTAASTCSGRASGTTSTSSTWSVAAVWVYGQTEVQKDLGRGPGRRRPAGRLRGRRHRAARPETDRPSVTFTAATARRSGWTPTWWSAATARSGPSAAAVPEPVASTWERTYPYSWLGILADVAPSTDELIYAWHPDGFALHSMRSATVSAGSTCRCPNDTDLERLVRRPDLGGAGHPARARPGRLGAEPGPITEKSVLPMRASC